MTPNTISTYLPGLGKAGKLRVMHDEKNPGNIAISGPPFHTMTQVQAIELANAIVDAVEEQR